ncbi:hypothetical protein ES702_05087 [subsurface metagenome]
MPGEQDEVRWRGVRPVEGIRGVWPERNATRIQEAGARTSSGGENFYTVPANKKLFISSLVLTSKLTLAAEVYSTMSVLNAVDVTQYTILRQIYTIAGQQTLPLSFMPALEVLAGWKVRIYSSSDNLFVFVYIFGWIEDE